MDPHEAEIALREARAWHAEGLLSADAFATIEARYRADAARRPPPDERFSAIALYGVGGAMFGAAALALVSQLDLVDSPGALALFGLGIGFAALALAVSIAMKREPFADALFVAALVPLVGSAFAFSRTPYWWVSPLVPVLVVAFAWLRRARRLVPLAGSIAFYPAIAGAASAVLPDNDNLAQTIFLVVGLAYLLIALAFGRATSAKWRPEVFAVCAIGVAFAAVVFLEEVVQSKFDGEVELALGALELAIFGIGLWLGERGLVVGAAAVLAVDAIVFSFDVGGVYLGVGVLVVAGALMLWQAGSIGRYLREPA